MALFNKPATYIFFSLMLIIPFKSSAQSNSSGFEFGLNFGVYMPSKYSANYYNGSDKNINNTKWLLSNNVAFAYDTILNRLNVIEHTAIDTFYVQSDGWPTNMHYKLSVMPGLYGQYTFNDLYALYFDFNITKLTTQDVIVFKIPLPYLSEPKQYLSPIRGVEERVYFDIGLRRNFPKSDKISYFLIGGLSVNNTTVKKSSFYIDQKEFSIINNYINGVYIGPNAQTLNQKQGGIGWGIYLSGGASFRFGNMVFEPGINSHFVNINLNGYKQFRPGFGAYIRINLNNFLFGGE
ncbi:MAG: hypothetical protein HXX13_17060 [Bacteroidetes bacterium]|nr:hypothetical protein [Bacteroidota bacterium]